MSTANEALVPIDKTTELEEIQAQQLKTLGPTDYALRKLRKEFNPENLPATIVKGDDAYQQVHNAAMAIRKVRTSIESRRKELKAGALEWGRMLDSEAKRLTGIIEEIEEPWAKAKRDADEEQERLEEEARQAEQKRVAAIEEKVVGLQHAADGLLNASSDQIKARLDKVRGIVVTEDDYEEYYDAAVHHHQQAMEMLTAAHAGKLQQEEMARQIEEQEKKLAEQQAEIDRQNQESLTDSSDSDKPSDKPEKGEPWAPPTETANQIADNTQTLMDATTPKPKIDPAPGFDAWWKKTGVELAQFKGTKGVARAAWNAGASQ